MTPQVDAATNSGNANTVGSDWLRLRHRKSKLSGNKSGGDRKDNVVPRINRSGRLGRQIKQRPQRQVQHSQRQQLGDDRN